MIRSKRYTAAALVIGSAVCVIDAASKVLVVADLTSRRPSSRTPATISTPRLTTRPSMRACS